MLLSKDLWWCQLVRSSKGVNVTHRQFSVTAELFSLVGMQLETHQDGWIDSIDSLNLFSKCHHPLDTDHLHTHTAIFYPPPTLTLPLSLPPLISSPQLLNYPSLFVQPHYSLGGGCWHSTEFFLLVLNPLLVLPTQWPQTDPLSFSEGGGSSPTHPTHPSAAPQTTMELNSKGGGGGRGRGGTEWVSGGWGGWHSASCPGGHWFTGEALKSWGLVGGLWTVSFLFSLAFLRVWCFCFTPSFF